MAVSIGPNRPTYPLSADAQQRFQYKLIGGWPSCAEDKRLADLAPAIVFTSHNDFSPAHLARELCDESTAAFQRATLLVRASRYTALDQEQAKYGSVNCTSALEKCSTEFPGHLREALAVKACVDRCREIEAIVAITNTIKLVLATEHRQFESLGENFLTVHEAAWHYCEAVSRRTIDASGFNALDYVASWSMNLADVPMNLPWQIELEREKHAAIHWLEEGPRETEVLSPGDLAKRFDVDPRTIARWLEKGILPHEKLSSKRYRVPKNWAPPRTK